MLRAPFYFTLMLLVGGLACNSGPHSSAGFQLPENGSVERGKAVFLDLKCTECHQVTGVNLPKPTQTAFVVLGGETHYQMTDGYLVGSIVNPSARIKPNRGHARRADGSSRMPEYTDNLTVRQLTDLVAFLQSHYSVRVPASELPQF